jgi:Na+/phosphate symporter
MVVNSLHAIRKAYTAGIEGLALEDLKKLKLAAKAMEELNLRNDEFKYTFYGSIRRISEEMAEGSRSYLLAYDLEQDITQSAQLITDSIQKHVADVLMPLTADQLKELQEISKSVDTFLETSAQIIQERDYSKFKVLLQEREPIFNKIDALLAAQSRGIKDANYSAANSILFFNILLETKDLISDAAAFVRLYQGVDQGMTKQDPWVLVNKTHGAG